MRLSEGEGEVEVILSVHRVGVREVLRARIRSVCVILTIGRMLCNGNFGTGKSSLP